MGDNLDPGSPESDYDDGLFPTPDDGFVNTGMGHVSLESRDNVDAQGAVAIPFSSIHKPPLSFKHLQRKVFIPSTDIKVKIVDYERSVTTHLLNPNLYTIQVEHGDFSWRIQRRYKQFQNLHQQLKLFRTSMTIPFPTKSHRERRSSFKRNGEKKGYSALPRFPNKPEALVPHEDLERRTQQLEDYLNNLLKIRQYRNHHETLNFLEVSHLSFVEGLGMKGKEGLILKRTGSTQPGRTGCNFCGLLNSTVCTRCSIFCSDMCGKWRQRWFFVKDTYFGYIRPKDGRVKCVMLFDSGFEVSSGIYSTGLHHGLQIINLSRHLVVKCWTRRKRKEWIACLKEISGTKARDFTIHNRHNCYAPERKSIEAAWFVDGCSYMAAVAEALEAAKEEIFITDWWLSPEIHLKRPSRGSDFWRLDCILERKAAEGVKIFVMLYKEVELALGINSYYSKQKLVSKFPENIKVLRHPDHAKVGVFLWAHHEKLVIIDQTYAFVGGIDLCYGRWDDHQHRLTDLGGVSQNLPGFLPGRRVQTSSTPIGDSNMPSSLLHLAVATNKVGVGALGASHPNIAFSTEKEEKEFTEEPLEKVKCTTPEAEHHNFMNKVRHYTGWINHHFQDSDEDEAASDKDSVVGETQDTLVPKLQVDKLETTYPAQKLQFSDDNGITGMLPDHKPIQKCTSLGVLPENCKYWIGKDYTNFIVKDFENLDLPYVDLVDRNTTPRMPWHDIGVMVQGSSARDVARHFIQRWNAVKLEKARLNPLYPYLLPKSYDNIDKTPIRSIIEEQLYKVDCQVLRSVCSWSAGFLDPDYWEESIHEAYLDAITNAKHYVYIENQFFITLALHSVAVRNQIGETLFKRIMRAHKEGSVFRVYVVLPLLPGFEGEVGSPKGTALHAITHWNYSSICRGNDSLLKRMVESGITDPSQYITFHGLRTHSALHSDLVSELIYVHSKLLIADDNLVICGSANINDRSLVGKRDSEVAVIIKDIEYDVGLMNGEAYQCGKYAGSLRKYLFQEHLGLIDDVFAKKKLDVTDPISDSFYREVWQAIATKNTQIFEDVFHCIPSDQATSFYRLRKFQEEIPMCRSDPMRASKLLEDIQGHIVNMPLEFLKSEVLTPNPGSVEGMLPTSVWT